MIEAWQEWGPDQPDEIWSAAHLASAAGGGNPTVTIAAFSLGSYGDLQNALDRLADRAGAPAASVSLHRTGFQDAMLLYAGCSTLSQAQCHLPGKTPGRSPQGVLQRETYAAQLRLLHQGAPRGGRTSTPQQRPGVHPHRGVGRRGRRHHRAHRARRRDQPGRPGRHRLRPPHLAGARPVRRVLAAGHAGRTQQSWLTRTHGAMRPYASGAAYQNYPDPRSPTGVRPTTARPRRAWPS